MTSSGIFQPHLWLVTLLWGGQVTQILICRKNSLTSTCIYIIYSVHIPYTIIYSMWCIYIYIKWFIIQYVCMIYNITILCTHIHIRRPPADARGSAQGKKRYCTATATTTTTTTIVQTMVQKLVQQQQQEQQEGSMSHCTTNGIKTGRKLLFF